MNCESCIKYATDLLKNTLLEVKGLCYNLVLYKLEETLNIISIVYHLCMLVDKSHYLISVVIRMGSLSTYSHEIRQTGHLQPSDLECHLLVSHQKSREH